MIFVLVCHFVLNCVAFVSLSSGLNGCLGQCGLGQCGLFCEGYDCLRGSVVSFLCILRGSVLSKIGVIVCDFRVGVPFRVQLCRFCVSLEWSSCVDEGDVVFFVRAMIRCGGVLCLFCVF